ncbi:MAG: LCP family protein [Coriobacteriaceae bacterium]|nr:LCP family protein [Coriobacteriaceae bacterium]
MGKKAIQQGWSTSGTSSRIYSRENVARYSERARQRRRGRMIRNTLLCTLVGVLICGVSACGMWFSSVAGKLKGNSITDNLLATLVDSNVTKDPFYMLLLGTDGRPGEDTFRSDTIILSRIDPKAKQVTLISIPRDTKVELSNGETAKINAAHALGGPEEVVRAVNELCGVKISHYAEVSFEGMEKVVDAVGGVTVNVPDRINDPKAGPMVIEPGEQKLDGASALAFCRSRAFPDGDYTRMRHQRIFIAALARTILESTNPSNVMQLIDSLGDMVDTDMSIQDIASLANAMRGMNTDEIWSANLPSWAGDDTYVNGVSYVFADEPAVKEMMARVDAGEDPRGPQTMGTTGDSSATTGDLSSNKASDWSNGTARVSSSSDAEAESASEELPAE